MSQKSFKPQTCFVVMPFNEKFDRVYEAIVAAVTGPELHFPSCVRADDIHGGGHVMEAVRRNIEQSEVIVADVTGRNPNVFYELGYAHKARPVENVIIITQSMKHTPFDIYDNRSIVYDTSDTGLEMLKQGLVNYISKATPAHLRFVVANKNTFEFHNRLRGLDKCHYGFDLRPVSVAMKGARFGVTVRRYGDDDELDKVFEKESHSLDEGEGIVVPHLNWRLILDAVSKDKAYFCLCEPVKDGEATGPRLTTGGV